MSPGNGCLKHIRVVEFILEDMRCTPVFVQWLISSAGWQAASVVVVVNGRCFGAPGEMRDKESGCK